MSLVSSFRQPTCLGYLVPPRLAIGYYFFKFGWAKLSPRFFDGGFAHQVSENLAKDPFAWHRNFIAGTVIPHAHLFSYLVCFGEIAIGVSLVTGFLVRPAALFGAFHNFNIYLAIAYAAGGLQGLVNILFIILQLMFVFSAAGRAWGVDGMLKKVFPHNPVL